MTAMVAEDLAQIPMSPFLAASLERAAEYASAQAHREVTLEHVLLALAEDPEASVILRSSNVDLAQLQSDVSNFVGNITDRQDPSDPRPVSTSPDLQRILEAAAEAAKQGQRREINGAILLAAIVGDGNSSAAHILRAQGLTFEATIAALRNAAHQPPPPAADATNPSPPASSEPAPPVTQEDPTTEDVLATARHRVDTASGRAGQEQSSPSLEPQWEPASTSSETRAPSPQPPAPAPTQRDPSATPSGNPNWAPPQSAETSERAPPRLQRVPPPLPPDAGMRPPRSQQTSPPPTLDRDDTSSSVEPARRPPQGQPPTQVPANAPVRSTSGPFGGAVQPQHAQAPHVPPWVGNASTAHGGRRQGPAQSAPHSQQPRSTQVRVETGQLVENIPRKMKTGVSQLIEVRIARANVKALAQGLQGGGAAYKHEAMITKAMSVKLRAPDGGFWVEAASPETQWIDNVLGVMTDDFASWRWTVTPKASGRKKLQLVVSARTVGSDGLAAETALPDQLYDVRVSVNYRHVSKRAAVWLTAAVFGGVLARFGEGAFDMAKAVVSKIVGV